MKGRKKEDETGRKVKARQPNFSRTRTHREFG